MPDESAEPEAPPAPPPYSANPLRTLADVQLAMADAAALGFIDAGHGRGGRPRRTGYWLAQRLCVPGAWTKNHERSFKIAYLAGYDHAAIVGRGAPRRPQPKSR